MLQEAASACAQGSVLVANFLTEAGQAAMRARRASTTANAAAAAAAGTASLPPAVDSSSSGRAVSANGLHASPGSAQAAAGWGKGLTGQFQWFCPNDVESVRYAHAHGGTVYDGLSLDCCCMPGRMMNAVNSRGLGVFLADCGGGCARRSCCSPVGRIEKLNC